MFVDKCLVNQFVFLFNDWLLGRPFGFRWLDCVGKLGQISNYLVGATFDFSGVDSDDGLGGAGNLKM